MIQLVEPFAGFASTSLFVAGVEPPVSRIGSKLRAAPLHARIWGVEPSPSCALAVAETDPRLRPFWAVVEKGLECDVAEMVLALGRRRPARDLWEECRAAEADGGLPLVEAAARSLILIAGARGGVGGFKGPHRLRPSVDGFIPCLDTVAARLERLALAPFDAVKVAAEAQDLAPRAGCFVLVDPPYSGKTAYRNGRPRPGLAAEIATAWAAAGSSVIFCEAVRPEIPALPHVAEVSGLLSHKGTGWGGREEWVASNVPLDTLA